jgi:hypothetical protein
MTSLQFSPTLNRMIRQDAPTELGAPTRPFLAAAVREGRADQAIQWLDYYLLELAQIRYIFGVWDWYMVRYYLDRKGDDALKFLLQQSVAPWLGTTAGLNGDTVADVEVDGRTAQLTVRGLERAFHFTEGETRYHLSLDTLQAQERRWGEWRTKIDAAIRAGDIKQVNQLLDEHIAEARLIHDVICDWAWALLTVIARTWGEAILGQVLRVTEEPWVTVRYEKIRNMSVDDSLRLTIEGMRGHFSGAGRAGTIDVIEEPDRYVLSFDACGTGGRMRRGDPLVGSGSRLAPPYNFVNIEGAYDWTWNRKGVCAYCAHCAVVNQILPIEGLGRPMRMTLNPENPNDPCRWIIYKDPHGFPDEAFTSVGKQKASRVK